MFGLFGNKLFALTDLAQTYRIPDGHIFAFFVVCGVHAGSYLGGFLGTVLGVVFVVRCRRIRDDLC